MTKGTITTRSIAEIDLIVGENIRKFRQARRVTQVELAAVIEVSFQQLQKYESGKNRTSAGKLYLISQFLDVPIAQFFTR
ncbi:Uncharacterised protein [Halioglobus japonicus]|nr:Uncharacterised protein [Halioglobus japonicus]